VSKPIWSLTREEYIMRGIRQEARNLSLTLSVMEKSGVVKQSGNYQRVKNAVHALEMVADKANMGVFEVGYEDLFDKYTDVHVELIDTAIGKGFPVPDIVKEHYKDARLWLK